MWLDLVDDERKRARQVKAEDPDTVTSVSLRRIPHCRTHPDYEIFVVSDNEGWVAWLRWRCSIYHENFEDFASKVVSVPPGSIEAQVEERASP